MDVAQETNFHAAPGCFAVTGIADDQAHIQPALPVFTTGAGA
ncbi:hypothetical protein V5F01_12080 [Streptomyces sp. NRRL B-2790]